MKTNFIFLCLFISGGLANATIQNKANPDKPSTVVIATAIGSAFYCDFDFTKANTSWNWQDGVGGNLSYISSLFGPPLWENGDYEGFYVAWNADGNGTYQDWQDTYNEDGTTNRWLTYSGVNNSPWHPQEIGSLTDPNDARTSKVIMQLKTGGKSTSNQNSLFVISADATGYRGIRAWDAVLTPAPYDAYSIPANSIKITGKTVGSDGNLYVVLPNNANIDVTPKSSAPYYGFNVTATKHKLYVQANTSILHSDYVVPTGTFSVGQKLAFSYFFYPAVDGITTTNTQWLIGGSVVNGWNSLGSGYDDYFFDTDLLKAPQTTVWYYSDAVGKKATIDLNLQFSNGQRVKVAKTGRYTIVKPTVTHLDTNATSYGSFTVKAGLLWLSMGSSTNEYNDGNMEFTGDVKSKFPGAIGWTQLVNCTNESSFPVLAVATGGNWNLDGSLIYDKTYTNLIHWQSAHTNFYAGFSAFTDCPGIPVGDISTTINSGFMTFLRFKPSTSDSIWVTLARADWAWHAEANGDPTLLVNDVTGPVFTMSNQFPPLWYAIKDGWSIAKDEAWYLFFGL